MPRIAIIGAGITGVTSAYVLRKQGYDVSVYDRQRYPAMETSYANGGQLSASNAEVWNSAATVLKGLRWLGRSNAPLLLNPRFSWHKYSWLLQFMRQIPNHRRNTIATTRLAIEARQHLYDMAEAEGIDFDLERRGILHIYHDAASFEAARRGNELLREGGLERYAVTPEEARDIEPALQTACHAGFYTPSDATGDIHKFTRGLAQACERLGVRFVQDADVAAIAADGTGYALDLAGTDGGDDRHQADAVVVCAGAASRRFARQLGDTVNIYPVKGYSISVTTPPAARPRRASACSTRPPRSSPAGWATASRGRHRRVQRLQPGHPRRTRAAAGGLDPPPLPRRQDGARGALVQAAPDDAGHDAARGSGQAPGVFYNTGHGHLGWTLSAATAQLLAASVGERLRPH